MANSGHVDRGAYGPGGDGYHGKKSTYKLYLLNIIIVSKDKNVDKYYVFGFPKMRLKTYKKKKGGDFSTFEIS